MIVQDRAFLAAIIESSEDAIIGTDPQGIVLSWNRGAERIYGFSAGEAIGRNISFLHLPHQAGEQTSIRARLNRGETIESHETERLSKDGRVMHVSVSLAPVRGDDGRIVGSAGISRDITEQSAIAEQLRHEKETLELVGRATNDMIWDWDLRTGQVTRSPGLESYGYSPHEITADHTWWSSRLHPDDAVAVESSFAEMLRTDHTTWSAAYRFRNADGTYASVIDRGHVVRDASGAAVRVVGSMLDTTERDHAQELAKRSTASAQLLSRASHELRTPLNAILGFSDLLEQRLEAVLGPRERRYLQNIRGSGEHLLKLIDRLLLLAKADSGELLLQRTVVGLSSLIEGAIAMTAERAAAAGVELIATPLPDASIRVDRAQLARVLGELLTNAVTATPAGGSVTLSAAIPSDDLVLEVTDTGSGIPEGAKERVFGVFENVHDQGDRSGTGLGLALCRDLVELHGGTIEFESEPGRGSTFRIRMPHAAWRREGSDRVLIVDDDPNDADLAMTICAETAIRCEVVGTVADALSSIHGELPRAAIVDLHLPDGSGRAVLAELRAADSTIPVLLVTADPESPAGARRGELAMKPVSPDRLREWLLAATATEVPA